MTMEVFLEAIAQKFDCTCQFESDGTTVLLETWSPEGQDVFFEAQLEDPESCEEFLEALKEHAANYDPDEEAALWLGSDGHGKNGAPYRMSDLLEDMQWAEKFFTDVARFAQKYFDEDGNISEQPRRMKVMVTRYGFIDVEASTEEEAEEIARNSRHSDFDWSNDMDYEVIDNNVI